MVHRSHRILRCRREREADAVKCKERGREHDEGEWGISK
jgi:hypothetical protein